MSAYSVKSSEWCPSCYEAGRLFRTDDPRHFVLHVPRNRWPAWMSGEAARTPDVAVSGGASAPASSVLADAADVGTPRPPEAEPQTCRICGRDDIKSAAGLAAHQRKHAREAVTSG